MTNAPSFVRFLPEWPSESICAIPPGPWADILPPKFVGRDSGLREIITISESSNGVFLSTKNVNSISGKILEIHPTRAFFKNNGDYGFFTSVKIKENNKIKQLFIWDEKVKEIQKFESGDFIMFEGIVYKNKNGIIENHIECNSIIKSN